MLGALCNVLFTDGKFQRRIHMKNLLVSAAAILALSTGLSLAAVGPSFNIVPTAEIAKDGKIVFAKSENSGSGNSGSGHGSDDNGGDNHGGNSSSDDNGGDNRGGRGGSTDDNSTSSSSSNNSNNDVSGSGRKKPRIKGGSGCDDAGDVAEHAACQ
jgi:lipopolysaccharide export LptBFGC system permease protein LptF